MYAPSYQQSPTAAHCLQRSSQFLSDEGKKLYQSHTNLPLMQVSPVQYTQAKVQAIINDGRRLAGSTNEAVTQDGKVETFEQDGKICTGYEKNDCARYCEQHGKNDEGESVCLKWGEVCQGKICLEKQMIDETITVTEKEFVK